MILHDNVDKVVRIYQWLPFDDDDDDDDDDSADCADDDEPSLYDGWLVGSKQPIPNQIVSTGRKMYPDMVPEEYHPICVLTIPVENTHKMMMMMMMSTEMITMMTWSFHGYKMLDRILFATDIVWQVVEIRYWLIISIGPSNFVRHGHTIIGMPFGSNGHK